MSKVKDYYNEYGHYLRWIIFNGIFIASLYYGLVHHVEGALNVGIFIAWSIGIINSLLMINPVREEAIKQYLDKDKQLTNDYLNGVIDFAIVLALMWYGYIWLTIFFALGTIADQMTRVEYRNWEEKALIDRLKGGMVAGYDK